MYEDLNNIVSSTLLFLLCVFVQLIIFTVFQKLVLPVTQNLNCTQTGSSTQRCIQDTSLPVRACRDSPYIPLVVG